MGYDPHFISGVESFNRRAYFDSHDRWEEVWIADGRPGDGFAKALIQAAVAMHHVSRGNFRGGRKLLASCAQGFDRFRPAFCGIDIERLLSSMQNALDEAEAAGSFNVASAPQIELNPPATAAP